MQAQGKVAQIGVSNYHERHFRELLSYAKVRPAVSQFEVHPYNARAPLIELCRREGVAVEALAAREHLAVEQQGVARLKWQAPER